MNFQKINKIAKYNNNNVAKQNQKNTDNYLINK